MLKRIFTRVIAAAILFSGSFLGAAPAAFAQTAGCGGSSLQGHNPEKLKATLKEMSTNDPAVIDRNFKDYTQLVEHWRSITPGQDNPTAQLFEDALNFWREKKAHEETGGMVDVQAGRRWASYLQKQIDEMDQGIIGSWNWWNGYTVTFNANGGATYRGSSLVRSGVGRWQKTGGNSYRVHWLSSNTNDIFTLSADGMKLEGTYDGKPGVSTRKC